MRILLSCVHWPVAAGRFLFWALRRMGHEVITVGPAVGPRLPWSNLNLEAYEWKPDIAIDYSEGQMTTSSADVLAKLGKPPDLVIQMDANWIMKGGAPCPNVLYAIDNHLAKYGAHDTFDHIFLAHSWGHMYDLPQAQFLPCAYDPRHHYDMNLPRTQDVTIVGVNYPERMKLVDTLRGAGVGAVAVMGPVYSEYNAIYNASRIALVKSVHNDLAMRVFENMAQGCLVVADRVPDMPYIGLQDGVHYLGYDSEAECVEVVRWALHNWGAAQKIIDAAKEAVKPHTWEARAARILEVASVGV